MAVIRIEGGVAPVGSIHNFGHLYLVFDDGNEERVIRAGPHLGMDITFYALKVLADVPLAETRDARPSTLEAMAARGSEVLDLEGRDAEAVWDIMVQQAKNISDQPYRYEVDTQNSNSVIASVLKSVGIDVADVLPVQPGGHNNYLAYGNDIGYFDWQINGTDQNDIIEGGNSTTWNDRIVGNHFLFGGKGDDDIIGGAGADFLEGGDGNDIYVGGEGADTFIVGHGVDVIEADGEERSDDRIVLRINNLEGAK